LYGLLFFFTLLLALGVVLLGVVLILCVFSYIPAADIMGPMEAARRVWKVIRDRPGSYLLNLLVATLTAILLGIVLRWILQQGLSLVDWIGLKAGGDEFSNIFTAMPSALFGAFQGTIPDKLLSLMVAGELDWQFQVAGWLVAITLLLAFSMVLGFVLTYWFSAGVVNFRLCTQPKKEKKDAPAE
jgi:hypothetical protein